MMSRMCTIQQFGIMPMKLLTMHVCWLHGCSSWHFSLSCFVMLFESLCVVSSLKPVSRNSNWLHLWVEHFLRVPVGLKWSRPIKSCVQDVVREVWHKVTPQLPDVTKKGSHPVGGASHDGVDCILDFHLCCGITCSDWILHMFFFNLDTSGCGAALGGIGQSFGNHSCVQSGLR